MIKGNGFYCDSLCKIASCSKQFCRQVLMIFYIKTSEHERENISQRSEFTAKLSITAATVHRGRNPPALSRLSKPHHLQDRSRCSFSGKPGNWCGGPAIVQMPSLTEIGIVGGGGRGGSLLTRCNTSPLCSPPPPIDLLKDLG